MGIDKVGITHGEEHPQLLVTGGVDKDATTLQDAWVLDVKYGRWREVSGDECMVEYITMNRAEVINGMHEQG